MSDKSRHPKLDIREWIDRARNDPQKYMERQATEVVLAAVASTPTYGRKLYLKGGILMGLVYGSPRQSAEIDLTADLDPDDLDDLRTELDRSLQRVPVLIGYPDLVLRIQSVEKRPRKDRFAHARFPALKVRIAYAKRDSPAYRRLMVRQCPQILEIDVSYREPVYGIELVRIDEQANVAISTYSLFDLIAEKLRALLQQTSRNRYRRQDVYDIAFLLRTNPLNEKEKLDILESLQGKALARGIGPRADSLSDLEVRRRAKEDWDTLDLELEDVPPFDELYDEVEAFYRSLPWSSAE